MKLVKHHLKLTISAHKLTVNQLFTVWTQIEAYLYSRPIVPISQDANDLEARTPVHFLIDRPLLQLPLTGDVRESSYRRLPSDYLRLANTSWWFWQRWKK